MSLSSLPNELIFLVAGFLGVRDLNSFLQTHPKLAYLLAPLLHKHALLDFNGKSALSVAAQMNYEGLAKLVLSKGADVNFQNKGSLNTALHFAAKSGSAAIAKLLLENGADTSARAHDMSTPLHWAYSSEETVKVLLENGANPNSRDMVGYTPLRRAIFGDAKAITKRYLEHGVDLTAQSNIYSGTNILQEACGLAGKKWAAKLLLEHGANINAVDTKLGGTALHWAAVAGQDSIVRLLLENGADTSVRDFSGRRAIDWVLPADSVRQMRIRTGMAHAFSEESQSKLTKMLRE